MADSLIVRGLVDVPQPEIALLLEAGYLYLEMQKFKEAEEVFAGVAALVPHSDVPVICQGNLAFSQGKFDRAVKLHKEALARVPDSALGHAHLGEALLFQKKREEAKKALARAVELDAEGPAGQFAQSLLSAIESGAI
ncbi:MAG: tetratricopeptide repeat protein [Deltaproteobacteria bacterium]|nr:tetratricopeptide repeat protein [Deltaproteobacteria bacterium]